MEVGEYFRGGKNKFGLKQAPSGCLEYQTVSSEILGCVFGYCKFYLQTEPLHGAVAIGEVHL